MASPSKSKVYFFFLTPVFALRNRSRLKRFIEDIFKKERKRLDQINYIFCSDPKLLKLNRKYLSHDFYTDILTFNLSENKNQITGEVYISITRIRENARKEKTSFQAELTRVIFHGALHLCGYKDKSSKEVFQMRKREDHYLQAFQNVPRDTVST